MMHIHFALIAEGSSDRPLLEILIALCRKLSGQTEVYGVWANPTLQLLETGKQLDAQLRAFLSYDRRFNLVFVHRDADRRDDQSAREVIARGIRDSACVQPVVPVVPIQATEAWLLLDEVAIRKQAGHPNGTAPLNLPKPKDVERRANPKALLREALVQAARPGRSKRALRSGDQEFGRLRQRLFEDFDIDGPVTQLSAWQALVNDTQAALSSLDL